MNNCSLPKKWKNSSLLKKGSPPCGILFGFHSVSRHPGSRMAAELAASEQGRPSTPVFLLYTSSACFRLFDFIGKANVSNSRYLSNPNVRPQCAVGQDLCLMPKPPATFASRNPLKWRGPCPIGRAAKIRKLSLNIRSAIVESILADDIGISYLTNRCGADY